MAETKNEITVFTCDTLEDFIRKVRSLKWVTETIYRGHSDATWKLASVWDRRLEKIRESTQEVGLLPFEGGTAHA